MSESAQHTASGRIIFVDKDFSMRQMMNMILSDRFQVVTAGTAEEGLALVASADLFDIVISGFSLSGMNGLEFLRLVGDSYPRTVRILMTAGCGDVADVSQAVSKGHISRVVLKPFCMSTLLEQLQDDIASVTANNMTA